MLNTDPLSAAIQLAVHHIGADQWGADLHVHRVVLQVTRGDRGDLEGRGDLTAERVAPDEHVDAPRRRHEVTDVLHGDRHAIASRASEGGQSALEPAADRGR